MENIKELLDSLGLENHESIVYLEAIKLGTSAASTIGHKINLPRTTVRNNCEQLVKKQLMVSSTKGNTKYFTAENPQKIKNLLQIEKNKLEEKESKLDKAMSQMLGMYNPYTKLPKVTFYEGEEGIKKVLYDSLTTKETIDSYVDIEAIKGDLDKGNQEYVKKKKKLKIKKRSIYSELNENKKYLEKLYNSINDDFNQVKFLNRKNYKLFDSNISIMLYDNKVSFISMEKNNYMGVIIENKEIYNYQKNMFKFMWEHL